MTRMVPTAAVILLLTLFAGCQTDTGTSQKLPMRSGQAAAPVGDPNKPVVAMAPGNEVDVVEKMTASRTAYQNGLQALIRYYNDTGNHDKLAWAKEELTALDRIPQYQYIIEAEVFGPNLKAKDQIPAADAMYREAQKLYDDAGGRLPVAQFKDKQYLLAALRKYGQVVSSFPTSNKIGDAAYMMGRIHEDLGDNVIALQFYQRAYQWDPATTTRARLKAAEILDKKLHRRAEALTIYQEIIDKEARYPDRKRAAESRVEQLNKSKD
jgi:tetratricopeptide (TPR) repeat protein